MLLNFVHKALAKPARALVGASLMLALAACGGGGGNPGSQPGDTVTPGNPTNPTNPTTPVTPVPVPAPSATITLKIADAAVTALSGTQSATARAVFLDAAGKPAANVIVKFTQSEELLTFTPASGSVLTDASGAAVITVTPDATKATGAISITATASVESKTATGTVETKEVSASVNLSVSVAPLPPVVTPPPTISADVVNDAGAAVSSVSGNQSAIVRTVVRDSNGAVAPNTIVQFTLSNNLLVLTPASGSALTDANGVAVISVAPSGPAAAGATAITATAVVAGKTATMTTNLAVASGPLTVASVAFSPAPSGPLPGGSSASLNVAITSGGQPADSATGLVLTSLCVADGTATLTAGGFANGVQTASYVNKGCNRGTDTITATIGASSKSVTLGVDASSIGTILFISSSPANQSIVLKGSGGLGRQESALLTYRVVDQNNAGLAGVTVSFAPSTSTGGLTVLPATAVTDASGNVTTTVSSGTIPTPVRVLAQASRGDRTITGLSDTLIISTGLPIQKAMSLSVDKYNINGWRLDGTVAKVTVRLADQYGNPISDGTAVNFVTEGGAIGTPAQGGCVTADGGCSVELRSQNFRPTNGRVTVLAYVQGLENFVDSNGDGQYSCTTYKAPDGSVPAVYRPLIDTCESGGEPFSDMGDPFLDAGFLGSVVGAHLTPRFGTLDGAYEAANGDLPFPYNHATYTSVGNAKWGLNFIRATTEITFSDSDAIVERQECTGACRAWVSGDGSVSEVKFTRDAVTLECTEQRVVRLRLFDVNNNPLPAGSTLTTGDAVGIKAQTPSPNIIPSTNIIGGTYHDIVLTPPKDCSAGGFSFTVTIGEGSKQTYNFFSKAVPL